MKINFRIIVLALTAYFGLTCNLSAENDIMRAMRDEISRSLNKLQLEKLQKPYYIEYTLKIEGSGNIKASLGSLTESASNKTAKLNIGVRVGDYKFDNTNFFDIGLGFFGSSDDEENFKSRQIPVELDYKTLRRELWLATDAAYKQVAEIYSKKEATIKNRLRKDTTWDFLPMPAEKNVDTFNLPMLDVKKFEDVVRKTSEVFKDYPDVQVANVNLEYLPTRTYYINSEGREYIKDETFSGIEIVALTQSDDGMPLSNYYSAYSPLPDNLPVQDSLIRAARETAILLKNAKYAKSLPEPYTGPILFTGNAAAEVFAQIFAPNLVAQRPPLTEGGMQDGGKYSAFQNKVGGRVAPEFISIIAEPGMKMFSNTPLVGNFKIDDQGVPSTSVELVKDGYLKNLLSSRIPTRRIRSSNGHCRGGGAMLSNLVVQADTSHSKSYDELKTHIIKLCKDRELPFGLIVKKVMDQNILFTTIFRLSLGSMSTFRSEGKVGLSEVYKVYPDGREELVRGCEGSGFSAQSFKDILFAGKHPFALNYLAPSVISPFMSGGSQYVGASVIVPDLLFEDAEVRTLEDDNPKPPILSSPLLTN